MKALAIMSIWVRTSVDYATVRRQAVLDIEGDTTIQDIFTWADSIKCFERGDITLLSFKSNERNTQDD